MAMKSNPQAFFDGGFNGNATNIFSYDDFFVDDIFNFSNEDVEKGFVEEEKDCFSVSSQEQTENDNTNYYSFSSKNDFGSISGSELSIPTEDLAELEWLSHFVDDSFSEFSLPCQTGNTTEKKTQNQAQPETEELSSENPCFPVYFPAKARSKRSRISGRAWSLGSMSFSESSSPASESSSSSQATSLVCTNSYSKPPAKKQKKKKLTETGGSQSERRCSHCHVQKTPQWRTGPLGAKTLCNACGVRYKSGRLLPEYRPAISPTFSGEFHSNNHRKVLDMRRKKEIVGAEPGLPPAAHSY